MISWSKQPGPSGTIMLPRLDRGFHRAMRLSLITNWGHTILFFWIDTSLASSIGTMPLLVLGCATWLTRTLWM